MNETDRLEVGRIINGVRFAVIELDEAIDRIVALVEGVTPPPPDSTGTPLPEPLRAAIEEVGQAIDHLLAVAFEVARNAENAG